MIRVTVGWNDPPLTFGGRADEKYATEGWATRMVLSGRWPIDRLQIARRVRQEHGLEAYAAEVAKIMRAAFPDEEFEVIAERSSN